VVSKLIDQITKKGGGSFGGYTALRDFVIGPILVDMKAGEVRENIIIKNQERLLNYQEIKLRLEYRPEDIKAVKKEILLEKEWE